MKFDKKALKEIIVSMSRVLFVALSLILIFLIGITGHFLWGTKSDIIFWSVLISVGFITVAVLQYKARTQYAEDE